MHERVIVDGAAGQTCTDHRAGTLLSGDTPGKPVNLVVQQNEFLVIGVELLSANINFRPEAPDSYAKLQARRSAAARTTSPSTVIAIIVTLILLESWPHTPVSSSHQLLLVSNAATAAVPSVLTSHTA